MDTKTNDTTQEFDADFSAPNTNESPATKEAAPQTPPKSAAVNKPAPAAQPVEPLQAEAGAENHADNDGDFMTEDEVYQILEARVADAQAEVDAARQKQSEGAKEELAALKALKAAQAEFKSSFPPLTPAENIKQHLASEQAKRAARAGQYPPGTPTARVDQAFSRGNSRGWRRPTRGVVGVDGNLVKAPDGSVAIPRPMQVRPQPVVPSMGNRANAGPVQRGMPAGR